MNHWVMDYETLKSCFVAVFSHYSSDVSRVFIISKFRNDIDDFVHFLEDNVQHKERHISFNGIGFDSQITQYVLLNQDTLRAMDGETICKKIHEKAQDVISRKDKGEFAEYSEKELAVKQIDLFKMNHWDNKAKLSSLKWIQVSMDWHNVQDMPLPHDHMIQSVQEQNEIVRYCINDVLSTKKIMKLSVEQIRLRKTLTDTYNINLYSASETRIAKELFLHFLELKTGIRKYDLKKLRTYRGLITVRDILLSSIQFITPKFQQLHENFKQLVLNPNETKNSFQYSINYRGVQTDFGLGGLHGAKRSDIYEATDGMTIMTSDVVSYYPNLAIRNRWSPKHIPNEDFCDQYEWIFEERKKIPKSNPLNYVYKIILNSTYGLSNDENSFLYDPEFTMRITINGQLSLAMLYEMLAEGVPGAIPLMQNTDGLEMMIPTQYKEKYLEICNEWERRTNLQLEHDEYQKMIIADVNNYIAINKWKEVKPEDVAKVKSNPHNYIKEEDGKVYHAKTKCKGRFEFQDLALHKNKSFLIIRKAIYHYFTYGTEPEEYLKQNRNIFDYCGGVKIKGNWKFTHQFVEDGIVHNDPLQKTIRYFICTKGGKIIKVNKSDGREIQVESGRWLQCVYNKHEEKPWEEYGVNDQYYLIAINKELKNIIPHLFSEQLKLDF
jgi:hypothetical protein